MSVVSQLDVTVASSIYGKDLCGNFFTMALQGCGIIVNTDILAFKIFSISYTLSLVRGAFRGREPYEAR